MCNFDTEIGYLPFQIYIPYRCFCLLLIIMIWARLVIYLQWHCSINNFMAPTFPPFSLVELWLLLSNRIFSNFHHFLEPLAGISLTGISTLPMSLWGCLDPFEFPALFELVALESVSTMNCRNPLKRKGKFLMWTVFTCLFNQIIKWNNKHFAGAWMHSITNSRIF